MTTKELMRIAQRASKKAREFRTAAIDCDAAFSTYFPDHRRGAVNLRHLAEVMPCLAIDCVIDAHAAAATLSHEQKPN